MASPGEISGLKTPAVRSIRRALLLLPAARLSVASSALETELSAVTTTRPAAASTYQAMPATPDRSTALLTAESWLTRPPGCVCLIRTVSSSGVDRTMGGVPSLRPGDPPSGSVDVAPDGRCQYRCTSVGPQASRYCPITFSQGHGVGLTRPPPASYSNRGSDSTRSITGARPAASVSRTVTWAFSPE